MGKMGRESAKIRKGAAKREVVYTENEWQHGDASISGSLRKSRYRGEEG